MPELPVDEPLPPEEVGPRIAAGRDSTIFAVGEDRVLRRAPDARSFVDEARVMAHVRAAGYPAPAVHRVAPGEMVLDRVDGPSMLSDLERRPWRLRSHARLLAELHEQLHRIEPPSWLAPGPVDGDVVVHLDLHPENVLLSSSGPVVIDWTNARRGSPGSDIANTWTILACFDPDTGGLMTVFLSLFRRRFVESFLRAAGREPARADLAAVAEYRANDRNIRPAEREALARLVAAEAG